jgi:hypothetical protein
MFFRTSYETTVGSSLVVKPVERAIKEACIKDMLYNQHLDIITTLDIRPLVVTGALTSESNIPLYAHPLLVTGTRGYDFLCADIRPFVRKDRLDDAWSPTPAIRNVTEYSFAKTRLVLNLAWLTGGARPMQNQFTGAATVYAGWLSELISRQYALDPRDQVALFCLSYMHYQSLFQESPQLDDDTAQAAVIHIIKATPAPGTLVNSLVSEIKSMPLGTLDLYCEAVKNLLQNIRLEKFNAGILITLTGQSWFGLNAKEILAIALEHPPTWTTIVYHALQERTYRNSVIAKLAERYIKGSSRTDFINAMALFQDNYLEADKSHGTARSSALEALAAVEL